MEYILKLTTTGSNNALKLNPGQLAYLRKMPFGSNTYTGNEINTGIFSFNVLNTGYYQLWTGESLTGLTNNSTFSTSLSGKLLWGDDINLANLTGGLSSINVYPMLMVLSSGVNSVSASVNTISANVASISTNLNSVSSSLTSLSASVGDLNRFTLKTTFEASTAYLYSIVGGSASSGAVALRKAAGGTLYYSTIAQALNVATAGDLVQVYKSCTENVILKDGVNILLDDNVVIDAETPSTTTIRDNGSVVKSTIFGRGVIQNSFNPVNSSTIRNLCVTGNTVAFTNGFAVFKATDNGASSLNWAVSSFTAANIYDIQFLNSLTGFVVGSTTGLIKTVNGGTTWSINPVIYDSSISVTSSIKAVKFLDAVTGHLSINTTDEFLNAQNTLLRTTDGGNTWTKLFTTGFSNDPYFYFIDSITGFYAARGTGVLLFYKTIDGGATWINPGNYVGAAQGLSFVDGTTGYYMSSASAMKTTNGGSSWTSLTSFGSINGYAHISFPSTLTGYVNAGNKFYKTVDSGNSWQLISSPYVGSLGTQLGTMGMVFLNTLTGYLKGQNQLYRTVNGGYDWTQLVGPYNTSFSGTNATMAGAILLTNTNSEVEINANSIWSFGGTDVTAFTPTIRSSARKLWINADKVYSNYNCAIYQDTQQQSTSCLNVNVKYMWTGMPTRNDIGSSVFVNLGTGFGCIDDIKAFGTGHAISHRAGELTMWVGRIEAWRNNSANNQIYTVYTSQGTNTQILNLNFDEIRYSRGTAGESFWAVVCGQGTMNLRGRLIYSADGNGGTATGGADAGIGLALDGGKNIYANVNQIIGYNYGVYSNAPNKFEIKNATISSLSPAYHSSPIVISNNNVFLRDCTLISSASATNASIENFGGAHTIKIINTYANSVTSSAVSCLISNVIVDSNLL